jgi:hypothetical protein
MRRFNYVQGDGRRRHILLGRVGDSMWIGITTRGSSSKFGIRARSRNWQPSWTILSNFPFPASQVNVSVYNDTRWLPHR